MIYDTAIDNDTSKWLPIGDFRLMTNFGTVLLFHWQPHCESSWSDCPQAMAFDPQIYRVQYTSIMVEAGPVDNLYNNICPVFFQINPPQELWKLC